MIGVADCFIRGHSLTDDLEDRSVFTIVIDWGSRKLACIHLGIQSVPDDGAVN